MSYDKTFCATVRNVIKRLIAARDRRNIYILIKTPFSRARLGKTTLSRMSHVFLSSIFLIFMKKYKVLEIYLSRYYRDI